MSIIAQGTDLTLDGKPISAQKPAPGVLTATITPSPGMHEIASGAARVRFFAGENGAPAGWKPFREHPPAAQCSACHAVANGVWEFKPNACFQCHDQAAFPKPHMHNSETLAECQLCHNQHGSTEKAHLRMAKEVACKQCHG